MSAEQVDVWGLTRTGNSEGHEQLNDCIDYRRGM